MDDLWTSRFKFTHPFTQSQPQLSPTRPGAVLAFIQNGCLSHAGSVLSMLLRAGGRSKVEWDAPAPSVASSDAHRSIFLYFVCDTHHTRGIYTALIWYGITIPGS